VVLLVALGAIALTLSYPPFPLPILSFFAITPAVLLIREAVTDANPTGAAFRWGWWYGLASNALVLYWLVVALWHFTPFSALGYLATIAIIGLLTGVMFWFVVRMRLSAPTVPLWVVLPVAWTALEWLIGHIGDIRFPWLGLGTSLADAPVLVQWADIAGVRGVTLWLAWCNVAIVEAATDVRGARFALRGLAVVVATVVLALGYGAWRMKTLPIRDVGVVGMVQPNEGFQEKGDPAHADSVVGKLLGQSQQLLAKTPRPQLIIWPEAAIPDFLWRRPRWEAAITSLARDNHVPIFTGVFWADPTWRTIQDPYYNAALLIDSTGQWRGGPVYAKHYLVPVTERVPFVPVSVFRAIPGIRNWSAGSASSSVTSRRSRTCLASTARRAPISSQTSPMTRGSGARARRGNTPPTWFCARSKRAWASRAPQIPASPSSWIPWAAPTTRRTSIRTQSSRTSCGPAT